MEEKHKQIIQEKTLQLRSILSTQILDVAIDLLQNGILTASIFKDIVEETSDNTKAKIFLLYIPTCGPKAFDELYKSVTKFELSAAAELLKPETKHGSDEFQHGIVGENSKDIDLLGNSTDSNSSKIPSLNSDKNELHSQKSISEKSKAPRKLFKDPSSKENHDNSSGSKSKINKDMASSKKTSRVVSIAQLKTNSTDWCIRAKVAQKSDKFFYLILTDISGQIKCTVDKSLVDKHYYKLEVKNVYFFSECTVKKLKAGETKLSPGNCKYELTMNDKTVIQHCPDDTDLPYMSFAFVKISDLKKQKAVDVIGVVIACEEPKSSKKYTKRMLKLIDESGIAVNLTLWGSDAPKFNVKLYQVIAVKDAIITNYKGLSLSVNAEWQLTVNPDIQQTASLLDWFKNKGRNMKFSTFQSKGESSDDQGEPSGDQGESSDDQGEPSGDQGESSDDNSDT